MSMDRRQFLSRFFKGLAVAAIAPEVIAKACEEHGIAKGTVFSFSPADGIGYWGKRREWKLPPHFEVQFDDTWRELMAHDIEEKMKVCQIGGPGISLKDAQMWDEHWNNLADYFYPKQSDLDVTRFIRKHYNRSMDFSL